MGRFRPTRSGFTRCGRRPGLASRASASVAARAPGWARPPVAATKGAGSRSGNKRKPGYEGGQNPIHMRTRKLRGPHPQDVDAVREVPYPHAAGQPRRPRGALRRGRRGDPRHASRGRPRQAPPPGQGARPRGTDQEAHGPRPRVQRRREGEDREGRRHGRVITQPDRKPRPSPPATQPSRSSRPSNSLVLQTLANSFRVPEIRMKLAFTAAMLLLYRLGAYIPAGYRHRRGQGPRVELLGQRDPAVPQPFQRGKPVPIVAVRAGIMPYITASIILQLMTVWCRPWSGCRRRARSASRRSRSTPAS